MDDDETLRAIREHARAAGMNGVLEVGQELHDLKGVVTTLRLRVDRMALVRLPLRAPWLALALSAAALAVSVWSAL